LERGLLILIILLIILIISIAISLIEGLYVALGIMKILRGANTKQAYKNSTTSPTGTINPITVQEDKPTEELKTDNNDYFERYTGGTDFYEAMTPKKEVK